MTQIYEHSRGKGFYLLTVRFTSTADV